MTQLVNAFNFRKPFHVLQEISMLEYNWNGYGASAGSSYPSEKALSLLQLMFKEKVSAPFVTTPTAQRSIQMEWFCEPKAYISIEIFDHKISVLRIDRIDNINVTNTRYYSYNEIDYVIKQIKRWEENIPFLTEGGSCEDTYCESWGYTGRQGNRNFRWS